MRQLHIKIYQQHLFLWGKFKTVSKLKNRIYYLQKIFDKFLAFNEESKRKVRKESYINRQSY